MEMHVFQAFKVIVPRLRWLAWKPIEFLTRFKYSNHDCVIKHKSKCWSVAFISAYDLLTPVNKWV